MKQQAVARPSLRTRAKPRWPLVIAGAFVAFLSSCSATDDRSASWEYISPALFQPNCATVSCHSRATAVAGLDFSDPDRGYTSLTGLEVSVGQPGDPGAPNLRPLVTAFVPAQSRIVNMLRARAAPRMPPDRPLSEADIRLVETWILNGARKSVNGGGVTDGGARIDAGDGNAPLDMAPTNDARPSDTGPTPDAGAALDAIDGSDTGSPPDAGLPDTSDGSSQ